MAELAGDEGASDEAGPKIFFNGAGEGSKGLEAVCSSLPMGIEELVLTPSGAIQVLVREDISAADAETTTSHPDDFDSPPSTPTDFEGSLNCGTSIVAHGSPRTAIVPMLEGMSKFAMMDVSMVDSVTDNLVKVSIEHAVNSSGEDLHKECGNSLQKGKGSYSQSQEGWHSMLAFENEGVSVEKNYPNDEPLQHNTGVGDMQVESCKNSKLVFSMEENNRADSNKDTNVDHEDDSKNDDDNVMEEDEDDLNEGVEQESEDSDSSSSTSTLSFSSSSDGEEADRYQFMNNLNQELEMEAESECEEGELKESPSQRKKTNVKKKNFAENSEDEGGLKEPMCSRNDMKDLPHVPKVSVTLQSYHTMEPAGFVSSVVGVRLIVEGIDGQQPLSEGSILWLTEQRSSLGIVDELFGPVKKPFYVVRYNDASELPAEAKEGAKVSYVRDFADFVLNNPDLYAKGYDNICENTEELSDSEVYFSDDEKEAEYKRSKSRTKRGNSELRTPDVDTRQHQDRTQGKRSNKDNRKQRSRRGNARTLPPNNDFSTRLPRHHQGERDLPFERHQGISEPPYRHHQVHPVSSQRSCGVGQWKSSTPPRHAISVSDEAGVIPKQQVRAPKKDHLKASSQPFSQNVQPTHSNRSSQSTSWEPQLPQTAESQSYMQPASPRQMNQSTDVMPATSHRAQMHQTHSAMQQSTSLQEQTNPSHSLIQSTPQVVQVDRPHGFMQPAIQQIVPLQSTPQQGQMINQSPVLPQSQAWHINQPLVAPHMASLQLSGVQHSQLPVCSAAMVVGQVSLVTGTGYGIPTPNNVPIQSGVGIGQGGLLPMHQPPIVQQVPLQKQFSSFGAHQFSAQVSPNMGMQMGSQVQAAHVDGYPMGMQPAATFSAPVLGIPVGSAASAPSNHVVHNQHYSGFTPGCAPPYGNVPPSTYGVPDHPRPMQQPMQFSTGTPAGSWQQQNLPQGGPRQKPYQQRPHQGRAPHRGPRF